MTEDTKYLSGRDIVVVGGAGYIGSHVGKAVSQFGLKGMRKIVERAGLNWDVAKDILGNEDWRDEAESNRLEMMERGVWGVPSFHVGETITWGQDRLWVVEHALQKLSDI